MQDLITVPMVDVISEITGREVVMRGDVYVYFDDKTKRCITSYCRIL